MYSRVPGYHIWLFLVMPSYVPWYSRVYALVKTPLVEFYNDYSRHLLFRRRAKNPTPRFLHARVAVVDPSDIMSLQETSE